MDKIKEDLELNKFFSPEINKLLANNNYDFVSDFVVSENINLDLNIFDKFKLDNYNKINLVINLQKNCKTNVIIYNKNNLIKFIKLDINLYESAELNIISADINSKLNIIEFNYNLIGKNSCVNHVNLSALKNSDATAIKIFQNHIGENTKSCVISKSILKECSKFFYRGNINIENNAINSQAEQKQISLILSNNAKSCAIPSLQIKQNKVKCAHGAATGKLDEDQLWYLQSRGLSKEKSEELIIEAFFNLNLDKNKQVNIILEDLKNYINL